MSVKTTIFSTTALVFLAGTVSADVSSKDIWADWQAYMTGFGYDISAQENMSGDTLEITGLTMSVPVPDGGGSFAMSVDKIDFVQNGDGTVSLVFPETMPMDFSMQTPDGEAVSGSIDYVTKNMMMQASGDPARVVYDYTADTIGFALTKLNIEGEDLPMESLQVSFTSNAVAGNSVMTPGALRKLAQEMTAGKSNYVVKFEEPGGGSSVDMKGSFDALNFIGETSIPNITTPLNMAATLAEGFAMNGSFGYTGSTTDFSFADGRDTMNGSSSADSAQLSVVMDKDQLGYSGSSKGLSINVMGADIPLPIAVTLGEAAFDLLMPISKADTPSDFRLGLNFADFEMIEDIWSLFDPGQVLPRNPATIAMDLSGKAKLLFDLFDPEQMEAMEDSSEIPAELNALTLNKALISLAGAEMTATGDFTFDNSDLESFDGFPKPTGGIDLSLVGGNGLMDKLVEMGLLPQEQAMGARMMMGLFARPGEGEDSLTSKIEINEAGHILANGQRIQ